MALTKFISCLSIVSAFVGTIFFVKGFLKITPDVIAAQSGTYWGYNLYIMESICSQKSNIVCEFVLVLIATAIQLAGLFVDEKIGFNDSKFISLAIIGGAAILLYVTFTFIDKQYTEYTLAETKKSICAQISKDTSKTTR